MKNSRTSTKKNNIKPKSNIRKKSTSPSSTKHNNTSKNKSGTTLKKQITTTNTSIKVRNVKPPKIQSVRKNEDDIIKFNPEIERKYMEALGEEPNRTNDKTNKKIVTDKKVKRKKSIKSGTILKLTFFIAFLVSMVYLLFNFETFNLKNINVEGNEKYTVNEIIKASKLQTGENIFKQLINSDKINLPYISEQKYEYSFPDKLTIKIKERYPMYIALDKNTKKYYKLDNDGYILEECDITSKVDEVLVEGFVFEEQVSLGEKINEVYLHKIKIYNDIKEQIESNKIQGTITKVNFANSLTIITLDDKLNIVFANDSNFEYKVTFLKGIIEQNGGTIEGTIDMSIDNPVYSKYD